MPKPDPLGETRIADAVERTKRLRRLNAKERSKRAKPPKRQPPEKGAVGSRSHVKPPKTKQQDCLDLLSRREGATIEELQVATGWQQHSVRGFLAGAVKKKLGLNLVSEKVDGQRIYRIAKSGTGR